MGYIHRDTVTPFYMIVWYYYVSQVYWHFSMDLINTVAYFDGLMVVTAERFRNTGMDISFKYLYNDVSIHSVWILAPYFIVAEYLNDPIYYADYEQENLEGTSEARRPNL